MCECVDNKIKEEMKEILEQYKVDKENLIPILNDIQGKIWLYSKNSSI